MVRPNSESSLAITTYFSKKTTMLLSLVGIAIIFVLFHYHRDTIKSAAQYAVNNYGYPALFVSCWFADVMIQPIPADFLVFGMVFGGASIFTTSVVAGMSSGCGGMTGYYLGKYFGPWRLRRFFGSKLFKKLFGPNLFRKGRNLFRDHGALAVFVAGVSPIPYSAVCWIGGVYNTPLKHVIIASWISRTLRYLVVSWLASIA